VLVSGNRRLQIGRCRTAWWPPSRHLDEAPRRASLVHVVDTADPSYERQIAVTTEVLAEIGAAAVARLLLFTSWIALATRRRRRRSRHASRPLADAVVMSAKRPADVASLRDRLVGFFARECVETELR